MFWRTRSLIRTGDAARDAGDWTAAQSAYRAVLARRPDLAPVWVQYGHALKEADLWPEALAAYQRADTLAPESADTLVHIGWAHIVMVRPDLARDPLTRAVAIAGPGCAAERILAELGPERRLPRRRAEGLPERLRFVNIGTTGTCNASCVHCPTGKTTTAHVPRGTMTMELFTKLIDGIADSGLPVTDQIAFGLFGDALVDPMVVRRAEYLRARLPDVRLSINTNGAAFNATRHAALKDLAHTVALHCESLDPETYNHLMAPLRLERVMPKIEEVMKTFHGKVVVSIPISRRNRDEAAAMSAWFYERGARWVAFDPLSSRCAEDRSVFDSLALDPKPIACPPVIMDDLIVDCDGQVLICCQDFQRVEGIGSLATNSFVEVLTGLQRHNTRKLLAESRHGELATCSRCFADLRGEFVPA